MSLPTSPESLILTSGDVARLCGWSRWTARRWLRMLQPSQVTRFGSKGQRIGITVAQLRAAQASLAAPIDNRISWRLNDLADRVKDLEARADVTWRELHALRRRVFPLEP